METIQLLLILVILICTILYIFLSYQAWKSKNKNLRRHQKILMLDGWWIFNRDYLEEGNNSLLVKGRTVFILILISGITLLVIS